MLDWLKKLAAAAQPPDDDTPPKTPDEALTALQGIISDAVIEEVWDALDLHAAVLEGQVRTMVVSEQLGEYPRHAATIWLGYQLGKSDRRIDDALRALLTDSIVWAFGFEENHVLLGGALGALDGLSGAEREAIALDAFERLGADSLRRYWFVLKVRTDAMIAAVSEALQAYEPEMRPKMGGAFRQFTAADVATLREHYDPASPGAEMFVEAFAATRSEEVRDVLEAATEDERPGVREVAERGLRQLG